MTDYGSTDRVRKMAAESYVKPARRRGEKTLTIHSGQFGRALVEKQMLQPNRFPIVCNALRSRRFLEENHLTLQNTKSTAESGQSSTVTFVYRIDNETPSAPDESIGGASFATLRGLLKKSYRKLGGSEAFHANEREGWQK